MRFFLKAGLLSLFVLVIGTVSGNAQFDPFHRDPRREEEAKIVKDMLSKQQSERDKKEHQELLERAETALEISDDLGKALEGSEHFTPAEEKKLVELEKVVKRIRDDLGGDDDEEMAEEEARTGPKDVKDVFAALRKSTLQLVDEVKKTTRFSISAAAIQSSNTVLRLVRSLRFRN